MTDLLTEVAQVVEEMALLPDERCPACGCSYNDPGAGEWRSVPDGDGYSLECTCTPTTRGAGALAVPAF